MYGVPWVSLSWKFLYQLLSLEKISQKGPDKVSAVLVENKINAGNWHHLAILTNKETINQTNLDHFFVNTNVGVGLEVGHVEVSTRRSLHLCRLLVFRNPHSAATGWPATSSPARPTLLNGSRTLLGRGGAAVVKAVNVAGVGIHFFLRLVRSLLKWITAAFIVYFNTKKN